MTIHDEFSHIPSKSRRLWLRHKRDGKCVSCGLPRDPLSALYCAEHAALRREICRRYDRKVNRVKTPEKVLDARIKWRHETD